MNARALGWDEKQPPREFIAQVERAVDRSVRQLKKGLQMYDITRMYRAFGNKPFQSKLCWDLCRKNFLLGRFKTKINFHFGE